MALPGKPSSKSLGKRPARKPATALTNGSISVYAPSRGSSGLDGEAESCSTPPSVPGADRSRAHNQKRVLPSRARRGGLGEYGEVDVSILDLLRRREENDPLIPKKTVFVLTTNSKYIPSASTSQIGLNRCANERFFERPEVIKAFKEQQDIQIPEFTEVPEHDMVPSKLRARNGTTGDMDLSDAAYERQHKKHEQAEKRERTREKDKLKHEHYKLKERTDQLRTMDSNAFLSLPDDAFGVSSTTLEEFEGGITSTPHTNDMLPEGERRRQIMLKAASILENRYRALLSDKRVPKDGATEPSIVVPMEELSGADGDVDSIEETGAHSEIEASAPIPISKTKSSKRKSFKLRDRAPTAPPSTSPFRETRTMQESPDEPQPEAESIIVMAQPRPQPEHASWSPHFPIAWPSTHQNTTSPLDMLQYRPREVSRDFSRERLPSYFETEKNGDLPFISYQPLAMSATNVPLVSKNPAQKDQSSPHHKRPKLQRIRIPGLPEFSPTPSFAQLPSEPPSHMQNLDLGPALQRQEDDGNTYSMQSNLTAQFAKVTLSSSPQNDSISQPVKRRAGRPRKHEIRPSGERQMGYSIIAAQVVPAVLQRRAATAPVRRQDSPTSEAATVEEPSVNEISRTPLSVYEPVYGPGRRPFVPCIIAASKHNADLGRKSGRSVKAFGAEVPPFEDKEHDFELPPDFIEQVEDARDGPGARDDPHPGGIQDPEVLLAASDVWTTTLLPPVKTD